MNEANQQPTVEGKNKLKFTRRAKVIGGFLAAVTGVTGAAIGIAELQDHAKTPGQIVMNQERANGQIPPASESTTSSSETAVKIAKGGKITGSTFALLGGAPIYESPDSASPVAFRVPEGQFLQVTDPILENAGPESEGDEWLRFTATTPDGQDGVYSVDITKLVHDSEQGKIEVRSEKGADPTADQQMSHWDQTASGFVLDSGQHVAFGTWQKG